jgi:HSP20 family protein
MSPAKKPVPVTRAAREEPESALAPTAPGWEPFLSLRREVDRLFDDMVPTWRPGRLFEARPWARLAPLPAADIVEKDGEFVMTMDVPGMDPKDVEVTLTDDSITIRGEMAEEKEEEKEAYRLSERRHGSFVRSFTLPPTVDPEKITASYEKGVLTLVMPKSEEAKKKQRKIEVKAAA